MRQHLTRKNIISGLVVGILLLIIPFAVKLVQEKQIFKSKASSNPIQFQYSGAKEDFKDSQTPPVLFIDSNPTSAPKIDVKLNPAHPFGAGSGANRPSPTITTSTPAPTSSAPTPTPIITTSTPAPTGARAPSPPPPLFPI